MINKISTIPIIFHGGTYGTYLHWCLDTLSSSGDICAPFSGRGDSHQFTGIHLSDIDGWKKYCQAEHAENFVRFHPKTKNSERLLDNLNSVMTTASRAIYIYPDPDSVLLSVNNYYSKVWRDWWLHQFSNEIDLVKIYNNWPVKNIPIEQIPNWIKREFLSLYLMPAWQDQVEWNLLDKWNHVDCCNILVSDLMHAFESTISTIGNFCQIDFKRPVSDLLPYHDQNIKLQKFIDQDRICNQIVQSVVSDYDLQWGTLPLPSEAWVQWQLRNLGLEIRCHGLDTFPTNSVHLKELLYSV